MDKIDAIIAATFHIDPSVLADQEWARKYHQALHVMDEQAKKTAKNLAELMGGFARR